VPPTVSITSPGDEASVLPGFTVTADASDDRSVAKVELKVDGTVNDVDETRPYEMQGQPGVALGMHQVEVVAVDGAGNRTAAAITVVVAPACAGPGECEDGASCVDGVCLGDLGGTCELHGQCASGLCGVVEGVNLCTQRCGEGSEECPSGFHCEEPMLAGGSGQCAPGGAGGGGCAAGGSGGRGGGWLLGFALLLFVRRRR
jgi:hypothetical protein